MFTLIKRKNTFVFLLVGAGVLVSSLSISIKAHANEYYDAGWYEHRTAVLRADTSCGPGMARIQFRLKSFDSMNDLADVGGLSVNIQVWNGETFKLVRETGFASVTGVITPSICFNPLVERVNPTVVASDASPYRSYRGYGWWWSKSGARKDEQGYFHEGNIHIMQKDDGAYTSRATYPVSQIVNISPQYRFRIPIITSLYGSKAVDSTIAHVVDMYSGTLVKRRDINTRGGAGEFTLPATQLVDGYYMWTFTNRMSGNHKYSYPGGHTVNGQYSPSTGWPTPTPYLLDRVRPTATTEHNIGTQTPTTVQVPITVRAQDVLSGLARVTYVVHDVTPGEAPSSATYTYPFTVGVGVVGGSKDAKVLTVPFTLLPGSTYRYVVTVADAAGNEMSLPAVTVVTEGVRPDEDEPPVIDPVDVDVTVSVSSDIARQGDAITVTWDATPEENIVSCVLLGVTADPIDIDPSSGEYTFVLNALKQITVACTAIDGSVHTGTATVQVLPEIYEI